MRRIELLLPPAKFGEIKDALADIGIDSTTLSEVKVVDPSNRRREVYRGAAYVVDFALKVKVELVVQDAVVPGILQVLERAFGTERSDEARHLVCVCDVVEVVPIRIGGYPLPRSCATGRRAPERASS